MMVKWAKIAIALSLLVFFGSLPGATLGSNPCTWKRNDTLYNSSWYVVPKASDWTRYFGASSDYNTLSVTFYKVYCQMSLPIAYSTVGYILYYWPDGKTEYDAMPNGWYKIVDPLLECATYIGPQCRESAKNGVPYDWKQSAMQNIVLNKLPEYTHYHFKVRVWLYPEPSGYLNPSNFPPKYSLLRPQGFILNGNLWVIEGEFTTSSAPPPPPGGGPGKPW